MSKERIAYLKNQIAMINTYKEPFWAEYNVLFIEYWNQGKTVAEIAEEFEWTERSVKVQLTKLGIWWRARELGELKTEVTKPVYVPRKKDIPTRLIY